MEIHIKDASIWRDAGVGWNEYLRVVLVRWYLRLLKRYSFAIFLTFLSFFRIIWNSRHVHWMIFHSFLGVFWSQREWFSIPTAFYMVIFFLKSRYLFWLLLGTFWDTKALNTSWRFHDVIVMSFIRRYFLWLAPTFMGRRPRSRTLFLWFRRSTR